MGEYQNAGERSPPRNVVVVRRVIEEIWNQGNLDVADTLFTAAYVNAGGLIPDVVVGPEAIKIAVVIHRTAYPNLHVTIEHLISEGELVALQWVARSQAVGDGVAPDPSVSRGTLRGTTFCRLASGKIVESWTSWDPGGLLRKLARGAGLTPGRGSLVSSGLS
jgi:predicted ester cyclase